ncbi:MAG: hypothetical protein WC358_00170 [Ignavibacteria bacterium]|jgi:hypothetical protein
MNSLDNCKHWKKDSFLKNYGTCSKKTNICQPGNTRREPIASNDSSFQGSRLKLKRDFREIELVKEGCNCMYKKNT